MFKFFQVGGAVRDEILGLKSKDIDYAVVPPDSLIYSGMDVGVIFNKLVEDLKTRGFEIFLITPECFTIRAKFNGSKEVADFVLARKEVGYKEGTRTPIVVPGTLYDDLKRRDFTCNAIAKTAEGEYIDPFNGLLDIKDKVLRTPIDGDITFEDDPLRLLRALRFAITKNFRISYEIDYIINHFEYNQKFSVVSEERIREELFKMFYHDTPETLNFLSKYPRMSRYIFENTKLWLKPTNEQ